MVLTEEERKARDKARRQTPAYKAKEKARDQRPERIAKKKASRDKPENKIKAKTRRDKPENKKKKKLQNQKYNSSIEGKKKDKARRRTPEYIAKEKARKSTPEYKAYMKKHRSTTEFKAKDRITRKKRESTPEFKAKQDGEKLLKSMRRAMVLLGYSQRHSNSKVPCCRCCGENSFVEFLDIDHIAGRYKMDSIPELVKIGYSSLLKDYRLIDWILEKDFPEGFQILCKNCNGAKGLYGVCPHEKERKEETFAMMEEQSSFEAGF